MEPLQGEQSLMVTLALESEGAHCPLCGEGWGATHCDFSWEGGSAHDGSNRDALNQECDCFIDR